VIWNEYLHALNLDRSTHDSAYLRDSFDKLREIDHRDEPELPIGEHQKRLLIEIQQRLDDEDFEESGRCCPECLQNMLRLRIEDTCVDFCRDCRSFWFDAGELSHFTDLLRDIPGEELSHRASKFKCPVCQQAMLEYQFRRGSNLMVDGCGEHHGVYLQDHELIRAFEIAAKPLDPELQAVSHEGTAASVTAASVTTPSVTAAQSAEPHSASVVAVAAPAGADASTETSADVSIDRRRLRMALIGGGGAGFIGKVHRTAATLDDRAELVAGAFSSNLERSIESAGMFRVDPRRAFASHEDLLTNERTRPAHERVDFVSIATPNYLHFPMAKAALEAGFNVVCDKPMTTRSSDAKELVRLVEESGAVFALTHNYTGYPLVRQAREMIAAGELGEIRAVRATYVQGWMRGLTPGEELARGMWKDDPAKNGPGATIGDVGTHAYNLARFMTGLAPVEVLGKLMTYAPGRQLDDYGHALVRCENDALMMITVSQVTHGRLNDLSIEIDGEKASISWRQEEPNQLIVRRTGQPQQIYDRNPGADFMNAAGSAACRIPAGHPEAFFEAFANVYSAAFDDMIARGLGKQIDQRNTLYPNVYDGLEGVRFIEQTVASSNENGVWLPLS